MVDKKKVNHNNVVYFGNKRQERQQLIKENRLRSKEYKKKRNAVKKISLFSLFTFIGGITCLFLCLLMISSVYLPLAYEYDYQIPADVMNAHTGLSLIGVAFVFSVGLFGVGCVIGFMARRQSKGTSLFSLFIALLNLFLFLTSIGIGIFSFLSS